MATVTTIDTANTPVPNGKYAVSISSFLRPDNTTTYTALDVISDSTDVARTLIFPGVGRSGAVRGVSVSNRLETDAIGPRLWLFDSEPTNFLDNAAFALVTADLPKIVGVWDFLDGDKILVGTLINYHAASDDANSTSPHTDPVPYVTGGDNLYGLLQTVTGYTPIALTSWVIRVMVEHD